DSNSHMLFVAPRRYSSRLFLVIAFAFVAGRAAADLVWTPQTGWKIEGGVLSAFAGPEARNALDLMNKARDAEEKHNYGTALSAYTKVTKKYPNSIYAPEAFYRTAKIRLVRKQYYKAFDAFQEIITRYPNTKRFNEIIGEQYHVAALLLNGARNYVWGLFPLFSDRAKGVNYCEQLIVNAPYNDYSPLALMDAIAGHEGADEVAEAIDGLDRFINNYPQNQLAPNAYLKLASIHAGLVEGADYDQYPTREAITFYQDFMILFPGDHNIGEAQKGLDRMKTVLAQSKMQMADFYFYKRSNFVAARVFYNEAVTAYPDSDIAKKAKQRLAEVEVAAEKARINPPRKKFLGIF
ncbi:MAG: outer membrane protein assembly factor BamD, partial [Verrucomicrobiota bacterium]|nr:outer membrane protein assembly factor BamD [Verrucomicrobiota bacterium]